MQRLILPGEKLTPGIAGASGVGVGAGGAVAGGFGGKVGDCTHARELPGSMRTAC